MRVLNAGTPLALPAKCIQCGYGRYERRYIDLELDVEFYGTLYVCEVCFDSWFNSWETKESKATAIKVTDLEKRVGVLENERELLLGVIRNFDLPIPADVNQLSLDDAAATEEPKRPRRYPDDFNQSGSKPRPDDVLNFTG